MFKKLFKRYRVREEYDSLLSKTFYYTEKRTWLYGWEPYLINHHWKFVSYEDAKAAIVEGGKTVYHYL